MEEQERSQNALLTSSQLLAVLSVGKTFIAGLVAGLAECLSSHPLDTVKVRMQTSDVWKSPIDCLSRTIQEEGALALYQGMSSRVLSNMVSGSLMFGTNGFFRHILNAPRGDCFNTRFWAASALTGSVEALLNTPLELVKSRMQVVRRAEGAGGPSLVGCAREIYSDLGFVKGFFHGLRPTLIREMAGNIVYFGSYELIKTELNNRRWSRHGKHRHNSAAPPSTINTMLAGGGAGVLFWASVYPIDLVKSLIQTDNLKTPKFSGMMDCFWKTYEHGGVKSFYRGLSPSLIRGFVGNACQFMVYEKVIHALG